MKLKLKIRKTAVAIMTAVLIGSYVGGKAYVNASDTYIRDRVVMLVSAKGSCSGIQIKAPSGNAYILTAAHCYVLFTDNIATAISESGSKTQVKMVKIDREVDIMLVESTNTKTIDIARDIEDHEHIHTLTHGRGYPTYRTDGELLEEQLLQLGLFEIQSDEDMEKCTKDGGKPEMTFFGPICTMQLLNMMMTARVLPGSSGGAVLNSAGELVGIVSTSSGDNFTSGMVPLRLIKKFLRNK